MSREKQIEEMRKDLCDSTMCDLETYNNCRMPQGNCSRCKRVAGDLYNAGYRKQSDVVRCKDCNYFMEYTSTYKSEVEKADGDCYIRLMNSENRQYCACQHDDFCSFAKMKGESK